MNDANSSFTIKPPVPIHLAQSRRVSQRPKPSKPPNLENKGKISNPPISLETARKALTSLYSGSRQSGSAERRRTGRRISRREIWLPWTERTSSARRSTGVCGGRGVGYSSGRCVGGSWSTHCDRLVRCEICNRIRKSVLCSSNSPDSVHRTETERRREVREREN